MACAQPCLGAGEDQIRGRADAGSTVNKQRQENSQANQHSSLIMLVQARETDV